jgi:surface protein
VEAFGDTYQILVKSQGIQADGFERPDAALNEGFGFIDADNIPWDNDGPTKGIGLKKAVRYLDGGATSIAGSVANVTFGLNKDYPEIVNNYTGTLVDVEQDLPAYAYYVKNGSTYDVYVLSNGTIYAPANCKNMFASMDKLKTVKGNLDVSRVTTMESMFDYCGSLQSVDTANWKMGKATSMQYMFYGCQSLQALDTTGWNTENVKNMSYMFFNCAALKSLDTSGWDVGNVKNFYSMFFMCGSLTNLDVSQWDTSSATEMGNLFDRCSNINGLDVSKWDVSNVKSMQYMFNGCGSLTALDVSNWDTSSADNMEFMFFEAYNLEYLDVSKWDVSKVTTFVKMFASGHQNGGDMKLQNLNVSKWRPLSAVNMGAMFYGCGQLTKLDMSGWNTPNLTILTHTFADCFKLAEINLLGWQTPSLISMDAMFNHCKVLKTVNMSSFDTSNVKEFSQMFEHCYALETIEGMENWDTSSGCTFTQMFTSCSSLSKLNLSGFDTSSAYDNYVDTNNSKSLAFSAMFSGLSSIQTLIVSDEIVYLGNGNVSEGNKLTFPAPASKAGFTAKWRNVETGELFDASQIPEKVAATYEAHYIANT